MIRTSGIKTEKPEAFVNETQRKVYVALERLGIPVERIDNDPAVTMEDCEAVDAALGVPTVKTLLLSNRQQTLFYLYVMPGDKPFSTKDFGVALQISRVSFAPAEKLHEFLGTEVGATTPLSLVADTDKRVRLIIDKAAVAPESIGFPDGTTTCYMRMRTADLLGKYIPAAGPEPTFI